MSGARRRLGLEPAARTAAAWIALVAGIVAMTAGLFPTRAVAGSSQSGPSASSDLTGPISTTTTTSEPVSSASTTAADPASSTPTTTPTDASSSNSTTTSEPARSASTTTTTSDPASPTSATTPTTDPTSSTSTSASTTTSPPTPTTSIVTPTTTAPPTPRPGALSVSAPDLLDLGGTVTGNRQLSAQLGTVTVTDTRGVVDGAWTVRVSATPFTTGNGSVGERIAPSSISYWSGPASARTGTAVLTPGQPDPSQAVLLTTARTAFSATGVSGDNTASWTPTIVIRVPPGAVAGSYRGAIIHSVA